MSEAVSGARKLLIVGAHSGDFVWRAAGAIAAETSRGAYLLYMGIGLQPQQWESRRTPHAPPTFENAVNPKFPGCTMHRLQAL